MKKLFKIILRDGGDTPDAYRVYRNSIIHFPKSNALAEPAGVRLTTSDDFWFAEDLAYGDGPGVAFDIVSEVRGRAFMSVFREEDAPLVNAFLLMSGYQAHCWAEVSG